MDRTLTFSSNEGIMKCFKIVWQDWWFDTVGYMLSVSNDKQIIAAQVVLTMITERIQGKVTVPPINLQKKKEKGKPT